MTNFELQWCILVLAKGTNEADLRRVCANKLAHAYHIYLRIYEPHNGHFEVAVIDRQDIKQVQASFDVIDKRFSESYQGQSAWVAEKAWGKPT